MKKAIQLVLLSSCLIVTGCGSKSAYNDNYEEVVQEIVSKDDSVKVLTKELIGINDDGSYLVQVEIESEEQDEIYQIYCKIDQKGAILNTYEGIEEMTCFTNGQSIASVKKVNPNSNSNEEYILTGIMSSSGEWLIEPQYSSVEYLNKNFYRVSLEKFDDYGSLGYVDSIINNQGKLLFNIEADEMLFFNEATDFLYYDNQIYTYAGDTIVPELDLSQDYYGGTYRDGYYVVRELDTDVEYYIAGDGTLKVNENQDVEFMNPSKNTYWKWDREKEAYDYYVGDVKTSIKEAVSPVIPDEHDRIIFSNKDGEYSIASPDGTLITTKLYKEIKPFNSAGYALARELREDHSGGYWVVLDTNGNEVITKEAKIVEVEMHDPLVVAIRNEEGNEEYKLLNLYTLDLLDENQLIMNLVKALEN